MPREEFVTIIPIRNNNQEPPTGWKVVYKGKVGDSPGNYPKVELAKGSGEHLFTITMAGNTDGIKLANPADQALWVAEGTSSPTAPGLHQQIHGVTRWNDSQIVFKDKNNGAKTTLSYRLNFEGAPPLDPIIENGGGPGGGNYYDYLLPAGLGLLAGVVFTLFMRKLMLGRWWA